MLGQQHDGPRSSREIAEASAAHIDPVPGDHLGRRRLRDDDHIFARAGERSGQEATNTAGAENRDRGHPAIG